MLSSCAVVMRRSEDGPPDTRDGPSDTRDGPPDTRDGPPDTRDGPSDTRDGPSDTSVDASTGSSVDQDTSPESKKPRRTVDSD